MPVVSLPEIMDRAFQQRYGVAAFNAVDDITMDGVIKAAVKSRSPLIVQVSVKTVKFWGVEVVKDMFGNMAGRVPVPVTLHLDRQDDFCRRRCGRAGQYLYGWASGRSRKFFCDQSSWSGRRNGSDSRGACRARSASKCAHPVDGNGSHRLHTAG